MGFKGAKIIQACFRDERRGGANEDPQSMFLSKNKKNNVYPCKPQFYDIKVGFKEVKIIGIISWWERTNELKPK